MKKATIYTLLVAGTLFNSCKKKELPKSENESSPVFYAKCEINGIPVTVQAGVNNYFMSASHYQDQNNMYVYKAELKQSSCTGSCGYGFSIQVNDYKFSGPNAAMQVDSALRPTVYQFSNGPSDPVSFTGSFFPLNALLTDQFYEWHFSDGAVVYSAKATKTLDANKTYTVFLACNDPKGCVTSHMNVFKVGNPLQANIHATYQSGQYTFSADSIVGAGPYTYAWDFGDGVTSTLANPSHAFITPPPVQVKLTLTNTGNTCDSYYQINGDNSCQANFASSLKPLVNAKALSAVTIQVTDQNGVSYSSASLNQANSSFEIVSIEDYKANEHNEPTKKIKIKFNCSLTSSGSTLNITNGEAVIAVSYK